MKRNYFKRAVFTVEAAFIVPLISMIIVSLIAYTYFVHESVWSKAAAYEAALYGTQHVANEKSTEELISERLEARYEDNVFGFSQESEISDSGSSVNISWRYGILTDTFGELFTIDKEIELGIIEPVAAKRLIWAAGQVLD